MKNRLLRRPVFFMATDWDSRLNPINRVTILVFQRNSINKIF